MTNMKLSINFAKAFRRAMALKPNLRLTHVNLERNELRDKGSIAIAKALATSPCIIALNLASNEIKPAGVNKIFELFLPNQSLLEMRLGTEDGGNVNRANVSLAPVLSKFVKENSFLAIVSLRGMGLTLDCLRDVFENLRESFQLN